MFTCSIIILVRVAQQSKKFKKKKSSDIKSKDNEPIKNKNKSQNFGTRTRNLALMLIPVNILFLVFLAPLVIAMFTYDNLGEDSLTLAILEFWSYFNFSFNFFIYLLTSSKFREEFIKLIDETLGKFYIKKEIQQHDTKLTRIKKEPKCNALNNTELIPFETNK